MNGSLLSCLVLAFLLSAAPAVYSEEGVPRNAAPEGARVYFISPADGAEIEGSVRIRFGLQGMGVAPAGVGREKTGHHHLILDSELPPMDKPLPSTEHVRHFGGGQTEVALDLPAGSHTLQLVLGDQNHVPHDPPVISEKITVRVK